MTKKLKLSIIFISIAFTTLFSPGFSAPSDDTHDVQTIRIVCTGDIMIHEPQLTAQYFAESGRYDFKNNFKYVKKYIQSADISIANFESTFGGKPYCGYPLFSTPDAMADALVYAGFDVISTANNHMVDRNEAGLKRTLKVLRSKGLTTTGSRLHSNEPSFSLSRIKGVNIAVIAYTYESGSTRKGDGSIYINGIFTPSSTADLINSFPYYDVGKSVSEIRRTVDLAKESGAEVVILFLHFGEEYKRAPSHYQREIVEKLADTHKVDIIFSSHPHVLQRAVIVTSRDKAVRVPVYFSLGNFISNQRRKTLNDRYTEQGMIARVDLVYDKSKKKVVSSKPGAIPTWVNKYASSSRRHVYEIIPLDGEMNKNTSLLKSGNLSSARQALKDIKKMMPR